VFVELCVNGWVGGWEGGWVGGGCRWQWRMMGRVNCMCMSHVTRVCCVVCVCARVSVAGGGGEGRVMSHACG